MSGNYKRSVKILNLKPYIFYVSALIFFQLGLSGCIVMMPLMVLPASTYQDLLPPDEELQARLQELIDRVIYDAISHLEGINEVKIQNINIDGADVSLNRFHDLFVASFKEKHQVSPLSEDRFIVKNNANNDTATITNALSIKNIDISLLKKGTKIYLNVKILDAKNGHLLWSKTHSDAKNINS